MILRRVESQRYSEVLPLWSAKRVFILACGPSLTLDQVEMVKCHCDGGGVIAVNDAYLLAPWADVQYAADSAWHAWHTKGVNKPALGMTAADVRGAWASFAGQKCSIQTSGGSITDETVHIMRNRDFPSHGTGLSLDPRYLVTGRNSGFQSLNLAVLAGARRIVLLGFDGQAAKDGRGHFHGEHPNGPTQPAAYPFYRQAMSAAENALIEAGVEVVNCSLGSAIDSFPKMALEDVL